MENKFSVSFDLDGVKADYESGMKRFGFEPDPSLNRSSHLLPGSGSARKRQMYEAVKGTDFYAHLPIMPGATKLYNFVKKNMDNKPIFLTAAPKFGATEVDYQINPYWLGAMFHKRNWVETKFLPLAWYERQPVGRKFIVSLSMNPLPDRLPIADERFICTISSLKHTFMHRKMAKHQILVDDRPDNIEAWREAGGIGVQHTSAEDSIEQLKKIIRDAA